MSKQEERTSGARSSRARRSKRAERPAEVEVKVDRALKRAWAEAIRQVREAGEDEAQAFDSRYEALGRILDASPPLYLAGGYSTARDFLRAEVPGESERNVLRWVRVARFASPAEEERFGVSKLDATLDYLEALAGKPLRRVPVDFDALRIPVKRDGKIVRAPLQDLTVADVRAATRAERGGNAPKRTKEEKALVAALAQAELAAVTVRVSNGKVWLGAIPVDALKDLGRALAKLRLASV